MTIDYCDTFAILHLSHNNSEALYLIAKLLYFTILNSKTRNNLSVGNDKIGNGNGFF